MSYSRAKEAHLKSSKHPFYLNSIRMKSATFIVAIIMFGSIQFEKIRGRQNKEVELKRSVMTDMRRVGHLFMFFKKKFEAQCGM